MARRAPCKHFRKTISLVEIFRKFPDDATAEAWFIEQRWPNGIACPSCGSDNVQTGAAHRSMPFRCRSCRKRFSTKTGTVMADSNLGFQTWAVAIYLLTTSLKSVSSMKLHRDLDITQKSAWHLAHRIRETMGTTSATLFKGPVEVDETYVGGKRKNMHAARRARLGVHGRHDKTTVVGAKDRATNQVRAEVVARADKATLHGFVNKHVSRSARLYTDDAKGYVGVRRRHATVRHSVGEYVKDQAHTNGLESFWSMLKRGHDGTFHHLSPQHLGRYVNEFANRHNVRRYDTIVQMRLIARRMLGKRLRYADLVSS